MVNHNIKTYEAYNLIAWWLRLVNFTMNFNDACAVHQRRAVEVFLVTFLAFYDNAFKTV